MDQKNPPLISNATLNNLHECVMHAIMAFGKDICGFNCHSLAEIAITAPDVYDKVKKWLREHNITGLNLQNEPELGSWTIKACHTWEFLLHWESWCTTTGINNPAVAELVDELTFYFQTLYKWCFATVEDIACLTVFAENVSTFISQWTTIIAPGRQRNYYHWLEVEALKEIQAHGSVMRFASDVTESFVHVLKDTYLHFTSRGGGKHNPHWIKQAMERICIKLLLKAYGSTEISRMLSPYERKKIVSDYLASVDSVVK
eukprot:Phypoly_transcript_16468.p1 GENE.Phypoly_transcript_16468~~Phypoly_transcript_16468.p1  ORF type:complete len:279 (+),score=30.05 Phypoly_transcript_16468:61-837(+)